MSSREAKDQLYGVLGEFATAKQLLEAAHRMREAGYRSTDAFAPYPVEGLADAVGEGPSIMPWVILVGGCVGGVSIYGLQYWINLYAYPLNVGGRPLHSWPSFIPPTFELTVLGAALAGFIGLLARIGLPRLHHPVFEIPRFQEASNDAFFLVVEARDRQFNAAAVRELFSACGATEVWDVPEPD